MLKLYKPAYIRHMVWSEKCRFLCPSSGPSANLPIGRVWMEGSCHRRKYYFCSSYNCCWNAVLVHDEDILNGLVLFHTVATKVSYSGWDVTWVSIFQNPTVLSPAQGLVAGKEEKREGEIFYWDGDMKNVKESLGLFAGIHWNKTFSCTLGASQWRN